MLDVRPVYISFATWTVALGLVLIVAPANWYGPSWHYFPQLPHNGFGMGLCCLGIGSSQLAALRWHCTAGLLAVLFGLSGFVFWTAGIILGAEGILGHQGLMEAPFMLYVGGHKIAHSAALTAHRKAGEL